MLRSSVIFPLEPRKALDTWWVIKKHVGKESMPGQGIKVLWKKF